MAAAGAMPPMVTSRRQADRSQDGIIASFRHVGPDRRHADDRRQDRAPDLTRWPVPHVGEPGCKGRGIVPTNTDLKNLAAGCAIV